MSRRDANAWQALRDAGLVAGDAPPVSSETPWYLQILLGASAWIAAACLFGFVAVLFDSLFSNTGATLTLGAIACAGAIVLLRCVDGEFFRHAAVPLSVAGQALIGVALVGGRSADLGWFAVSAVAAILYAAGPSRLHRFLCSLAFVLGLFAQTNMIVLATPMLAWGAFILWVNDDDEWLTPPAWGFAVAAFVVAYTDGFGGTISNGPDALRTIANVVAAMLLPVAALRLAHGAGVLKSPATRLAVVGAALLAILWLPAPAVTIGLAFALLGVATDRVAVVVFGLAGAAFGLVRYYYQLDVTLLEKSGLLIASGALVVALRQAALFLEKRA